MEERIDIKAVLHQAVDKLPEEMVDPRLITNALSKSLGIAPVKIMPCYRPLIELHEVDVRQELHDAVASLPESLTEIAGILEELEAWLDGAIGHADYLAGRYTSHEDVMEEVRKCVGLPSGQIRHEPIS